MTKRNGLNLDEKRDADVLDEHDHVNSRSARSNFSRLVNKARIDHKRVVITDHGEPAAAIISIDDLRTLDRLTDLEWIDNIPQTDLEKLNVDNLREFLNTEKPK